MFDSFLPNEPAPSGSTDSWVGDAAVLNNIALGWAALFRQPNATVVPSGSGYQVLPYNPQPASPALSVSGNTLGISPGVLIVGGLIAVALIFAFKR